MSQSDYDASTSDYNVLRIITNRYYMVACTLKCEVLTLGFKSCRAIESPPVGVALHGHYDSIAVDDGAAHFRSYHLHHDGIHQNYIYDHVIARFDLKKEEWSVLPLPDYYSMDP